MLGKEVVRITQSKNKNKRQTLIQNHYQTGSQHVIGTLRKEGKRLQKRIKRCKKNGSSRRKRRQLMKDRLKRRMTRTSRTITP